jgi:Xaa-Pro aminopeptidase
MTTTDNNAPRAAARIADIQRALKDAALDGWLFYDFRKSDPLAYRILLLDREAFASRRWAYYVPATGEPTKIVHRIEQEKLDDLPGRQLVYQRWQELHAHLRDALGLANSVEENGGGARALRVAMQYSPNNNIPYISRVDAGTVELVRSFGAEPVTSADLVQIFEAVWTPEQKGTHDRAADNIHNIILEAFAEIARRIRAGEPTTEYDIQQFMVRRFEETGMTSDDDPPIVAVNANSAMPHYVPNGSRHSPETICPMLKMAVLIRAARRRP